MRQLSVWALACCEWRAAAPSPSACRAPLIEMFVMWINFRWTFQSFWDLTEVSAQSWYKVRTYDLINPTFKISLGRLSKKRKKKQRFLVPSPKKRALHYTDRVLLGQSRNSRCWRMQFFVTERPGGYNIYMSGWAAPYFSLGSARVLHPSAGSPLLVHHLNLYQLAHQRGVWRTVRTSEI